MIWFCNIAWTVDVWVESTFGSFFCISIKSCWVVFKRGRIGFGSDNIAGEIGADIGIGVCKTWVFFRFTFVLLIKSESDSYLRLFIGEFNLTLSISRGFVSWFIDGNVFDDEFVSETFNNPCQERRSFLARCAISINNSALVSFGRIVFFRASNFWRIVLISRPRRVVYYKKNKDSESPKFILKYKLVTDLLLFPFFLADK